MEGRQIKAGTKAGVKVIFSNVQSINNKIDEVRAVVAIKKPDIFAMTETWTNDNIGNSHLELDGFEIIAREDRRDTGRKRRRDLNLRKEGVVRV